MARDDENPAIHGSESGPDDDADRPAGAAAGDERTTPHLADQGKDVVDTQGEALGIVSDVDGETLYVEPDPTLTETIMSRLHWREADNGEPAVAADRVRRIDDDEVVIDVDDDPGTEP